MSQTNDRTPSAMRHRRSQSLALNCQIPGSCSDIDSHQAEGILSDTTKVVTTSEAASTPLPRTSYQQQHSSNSKPAAPETGSNGVQTTLTNEQSQSYIDMLDHQDVRLTNMPQATKDRLIMAEVKLSHEQFDSVQEFMSKMSCRLSEIYERSTACVMVMVAVDMAVLFNNSTAPAYQVIITAPGSDITVPTNKRVAGGIQTLMSDAANIPADRGIIVFQAIRDDSLVVTAWDERDASNPAFSQSGTEMAGRKCRKARKSSLAKLICCFQAFCHTLQARRGMEPF